MLREALSPLAEREFRLLFVGRLVSFLGTAVAPVALAFAVIDDLDGSASQLGLVLAMFIVPQIVFILVGGVIADRLPRHFVLVGSNVLSGAAQMAAALLLLMGSAELWHLMVTQFVRGTASAFFFPASTGIVPQTVSAARLQQANTLLRMTTNASFVIGAAGGGLLVATVGSGWAIAFDGLTYFASGAVLLLMRIEGVVRTGESFLRELREGWDEFRSREWLWVIVVAAMVGNMISQGCWNVLGPIVADHSLGGAAAWGTVLAFQFAGFIVGGLITFRYRPRRFILVAQISVTFIALSLVALALELPVAGVAAAAFVAGAGIEIFGVYWDTALQQHIPGAALSRVSSYDALGSFVAIPIGLTLVGPISEGIGITTTLWAGTAIFVAAQVGALLSRDVRTLERRDADVVIEPTPATQTP